MAITIIDSCCIDTCRACRKHPLFIIHQYGFTGTTVADTHKGESKNKRAAAINCGTERGIYGS